MTVSQEGDFAVTGIFGAKGLWTLRFTADEMVFLSSSKEAPFGISRIDVPANIRPTTFLADRFLITSGAKRRMFRVSKEAQEYFETWRGPLTLSDLQVAQKTKFGPIGLLALLWIPLSIDGMVNPSAHENPISFHVVSLLISIGFLGLAVAGRYRPHPRLFILSAAWYVITGVGVGVGIALSGEDVLWSIGVLMCALTAKSQYAWYRRFSAALAE